MSSRTVEQIKSRLNIADVISSYIRVVKTGASYKALCPFHSEKTPSMSISPERGGFHCFGCGKGGDIFTFVQEMEGLDFIGALRVLAERSGVEIIWDGKRETRDERERMYEILQETADFFHGALAKNRKALLYLKGRGLLAKTAEDFYLGFAEDSWDALYNHLSLKKYSGEDMEKAGLVLRSKEGKRGCYDRFRSRIVFPVSDSAGRIVGFSGRVFGKEGEDAGAKYINTPETLLYAKSKILYGLHKAKQAIRERGTVVVVEGQMDLLMSHQAGVLHAVAVSGTAFSEEHARTLKRFSEKAVFAFDSDAAGMAATRRAAGMAIALGMDAHAAKIDAKDPADMIREHPDAWRDLVESAPHVILFFLQILRERGGGMREFRLAVRKEVLPLVAAVRSAIDRDHFIETVSRETGILEDSLREDLRSSAPRTESRTDAKESRMPRSREDVIRRELAGIFLLRNDREKYADLFRGEARFSEDEERELVFSAEALYGNTNDLEKIVRNLEKELERELLKEERVRITEALSSREGDPGLERRHLEISRRLEDLHNQNEKEN